MAKTTKFLAILTVFALLTVFYGCAMNDNDTKGARTNLNDEPLVPAESTDPAEPEPKRGTFPDLDWETELWVKMNLWSTYLKPYNDSYDPDRIKINGYFGTYNRNVVFLINSLWASIAVTYTEQVAGFSFFYAHAAHRILILKPGEQEETGYFYTLTEAYNLNFLTDEDIKSIHDKYLNPLSWNPPKF